jgi:predicted GNAT family N-acyltransferase
MPLTIRQFTSEHPDFQTCFDIRCAVFVEEQQVPLEEERDAFDPVGLHFLAEQDGAPAGTARVLMKEGGALAKVTRVAVLKSARGQRIGAALLQHIHATIPAERFALDAQVQALPFYERLGYAAQGEVFMEANIPHLHMTRAGGRG